MSEREKQDARVIAQAYKKMTTEQKKYFLGYAQGVADAMEREETKELEKEIENEITSSN